MNATLREVTSLPVQIAALILQASVTSSTGSAAQAGTQHELDTVRLGVEHIDTLITTPPEPAIDVKA